MNWEPSGFNGSGSDNKFSIVRKRGEERPLGEGGMNREPSGFKGIGGDENFSITRERVGNLL